MLLMQFPVLPLMHFFKNQCILFSSLLCCAVSFWYVRMRNERCITSPKASGQKYSGAFAHHDSWALVASIKKRLICSVTSYLCANWKMILHVTMTSGPWAHISSSHRCYFPTFNTIPVLLCSLPLKKMEPTALKRFWTAVKSFHVQAHKNGCLLLLSPTEQPSADFFPEGIAIIIRVSRSDRRHTLKPSQVKKFQWVACRGRRRKKRHNN